MADNAAENEADSGSALTIATRDDEPDQNDTDKVTGSNAAYDSTDSHFRCSQCDFEAIHQTALNAHITQAHSSNEVDMEVENNNPPTEGRTHRKMFECDVCNMKFSNGANMRRHKMRHTGVKPYECRVCQKRFFRKDHLAEHFTTHTKTLPYHCPICNRGFQRQIAMRAHFQNEHVGQHDLVKSCPLCSYRAGSMKSLRVHFFNRHGIDLDNPGPAGSQASLLAAAAQGFPIDGSITTSLSNLTSSVSVSVTGGSNNAANFSDSGDSTGARSTDNATPPMHFLTPHVEISMSDAPAPVFSPVQLDLQRTNSQSGQNSEANSRLNGDAPGSPHSADSNSNAPTSTHVPLRLDQETNITPSISLIPIKQEPGEETSDTNRRNGPVNSSVSPPGGAQNTPSSLSSLIKVSPLKSLLRDDLKRKIITRSNSNNRSRSTASPNNPESSPNESTSTNGAITSTATEQPSDSSLWRTIGKRSLSNLQCVYCGITFPDQTLYFLHKGCHSDANPWKCNICGEQCCNVYEFNSHLLSKSHQ